MTPADTKNAVRVTRTIAAPPERVFRAWLDPELARQWMSPDNYGGKAEIEERVGGRHRMWWLAEADGEDVGGVEAEITELVPNERIALRWWFVEPDRETNPDFETRVTAEFEPGTEPGTTDVSVVHERLDAAERQQEGLGADIGRGWNMGLDKLEASLAR
jgi:uncharacterized protein YndB with AHSA1/START domain